MLIVVLEIGLRCPEEPLCSDDLALISESLENLKGEIEAWKGVMELKSLRVNVGC